MPVFTSALEASAVQITVQYLLIHLEIREVLVVFFHTCNCLVGTPTANACSPMHIALASSPCSQCVAALCGGLRRTVLPGADLPQAALLPRGNTVILKNHSEALTLVPCMLKR